ncbi:MAG: NAD-dependent epimerase/dehydratase family protein [Parvibaculaceae bacterium]
MTEDDIPKTLSGKRLLVTGAAGFIGGALFQRLRELGLDVVGTVLEPSERDAIKRAGGNAELLDLASEQPWNDLLRNVDIVFNVAAMFNETEASEPEYDRVNNAAVLKLAQTAERCGCERMVHVSTVGVHGHVKEFPARETSPYNPMDLYHRTKLAGELSLLDYGRTLPEDGMVVTVNRPAMVYGPGDMRQLKLFKAVLSRRFAMIGSGRTWAHFGYIADQVDSLLLGAVMPRKAVHGEAFNIASGEPVRLNDLVARIASIGGVPAPRLRIPLAPVLAGAFVIEQLCRPLRIRPPLSRRRVGFFTHNRGFDLTKAREGLGYRSSWDLDSGLGETIRWYRENGLVPEGPSLQQRVTAPMAAALLSTQIDTITY